MSGAVAPVDEASTSASSPSTETTKGKPVVVRVKRKASQSPLDAFWLEINERPSKRPLSDFSNLSIADALVGEVVEKWGTKKLLVQHLETVKDSDEAKGVLHLFLKDYGGLKELHRKLSKDRTSFKHDNHKQAQLRSLARKEHEHVVRNARLEQIWRRRRGAKGAEEDSLCDICHLYDVIQIDFENEDSRADLEPKVAHPEDSALLFDFLPLIREYLPEAASEIESDIIESKEDNAVYDLYTVYPDSSLDMEDLTEYPQVQVDDDEQYYDGPLKSEYESDDSNAEDNPLNDYPEEESSKHEDRESYDSLDDLESSDSRSEDEDKNVDKEEQQDWRWEYR